MDIKTKINEESLEITRQAKANWDDTGTLRNVYKVKLADLHYNDENGRIATWISMYTSDSSNPPLNSLDRETFNNTIEKYIKMSNSESSFDRLKVDLKKKGQLNPGVVLDDGTIVSGNRRFTALRSLYDEDSDEKYGYFECFILKAPSNKTAAEEIKLIETKTQFGVVAEEDYNAIDRLVTIYRYLIDPDKKIWSVKDYAKKINIKESEAEKLYIEATIMVDYLKFVKKPLQFHIARTQKIDGPLVELIKMYKGFEKEQNLREWTRIRPLFYSEINREKGDRTRKVRDLRKMYENNSKKFESLLLELQEKQEEYEEKNLKEIKQHQHLKHSNESDDKTAKKVSLKRESISSIVSLDENKIKTAILESNKDNAKRKPIKKVETAINSIGDIESDVIPHMDSKDKKEFESKLKRLSSLIEKLLNEIKD